MNDTTFQLSGFDFNKIKLLPKRKGSQSIGLEYTEFFGLVPTIIEVCPFCENKVKWRTTGLIPMSLKCDKCNQDFRIQ